jgi:alpha-tubulin suppressor-like RCC1 family protein
MNIAKYQILLHEAIRTSTSTTEFLLLSKALQSLNVGQIRTVATFANLPSAASNEGLLVWVTADERLYWSTGTDWYSIVSLGKGISYAWGGGGIGILGDGTTTNRSSPVSVVGGFTDWGQVSARDSHTAALRTNGTLWAWGCNGTGRLGDGTIITKSSPVSVIGGFTDWCQVAAGSAHTAALRTNGTLWAWGCNDLGRLGDGTVTNRSSPVSVIGGFTDWCQVAAGGFHTAAVRTNGTLWAWGGGTFGQLGDGTTTSKRSPVSVIGGFTDWCQVSANSNHTAAVRTNGTLWAWGYNGSGQLGDNTITSKTSPVSVVGGFTDWCQVSVGFGHTAAVRTSGTLWAWGCNSCGRLGDGTTINRSSPVSVIGGFTDWCQVSASYRHTAAVRTNGTLWAWGINICGQLGTDTITNRSSPVPVVGGFTDWCQVSASYRHTAALRSTDFT